MCHMRHMQHSDPSIQAALHSVKTPIKKTCSNPCFVQLALAHGITCNMICGAHLSSRIYLQWSMQSLQGSYSGNLEPKWKPKPQVTGITLFPPTQHAILHNMRSCTLTLTPWSSVCLMQTDSGQLMCLLLVSTCNIHALSAVSIRLQHTCFACCLCQVATYMRWIPTVCPAKQP